MHQYLIFKIELIHCEFYSPAKTFTSTSGDDRTNDETNFQVSPSLVGFAWHMMYYSIYFMYTINLKPSNNRTVTNYAMTLQLEKNSDSTDIFNINSKFAPLCDEQSYEYTPVRMQADSPAASSVCTSKRVMRGSWGLRCCKCAMQYVKEEEIFCLDTAPFWCQIFILSPQYSSDTDTNAGAHYCQYVDWSTRHQFTPAGTPLRHNNLQTWTWFGSKSRKKRHKAAKG